MSFSRFKLIDPEKSNYVELVIDEFKMKLATHKFIKEVKEKIGSKKEELELKFLYSSLSRRKEVGINVLIKFLKSDEFKTYDFDTLNLSDNLITFEKLSLIIKYLNENPFITKLNLSSNCLGSYNDKLKLYPEISHYFSVNTTLKVLDLSFNMIGSINYNDYYDEDGNFHLDDDENENYDIKSLMDAIKSNPHTSLTEINLSHNDINKSCIYSIARMLETNTSLRKLNLSSTPISIQLSYDDSLLPSSLEILGQSLLLNQTLCVLDISNSFYEISELEKFSSIIEHNYTLVEINYEQRFDINIKIDIIDDICTRNQKLIKSKEKLMNFILTIRKQEIKKRIFPVELYDLIFSEYILTF